MNKKRNRTVSRKKIQNAVVELLKNSNLENLKVTEICQKAHINRSTFYDNYTDIYDMADKLRKYLVDEYALTQKNLKNPSFSKLLQHVKDNQDLYRLFFKLNLQ
ncbi:MAG: TetR/AcrR family transcriptional regulator, partial [Lactobacillus sp.]|nr:TetR/AcrR family transcriptional regulator [Lactobacillus sp.]